MRIQLIQYFFGILHYNDEENSMNEEFFLDPAINRKSEIVDDALHLVEGIPLPSVVEISESGTCNRKCVFCPRSDPDFKDIKEFIDPGLVKKLVSELAEFSYSGIFLFSGFVEPLLDKQIYSHIKMIHEHLPYARIEMVTNGDVLNADRLKLLFESGLSTILISVYDSLDDADRFETMCLDCGLNKEQFVIRHRYLSESESFGITINNRAGMMAGASYSIPEQSKALQVPCYYPHYTFFMDYLGDVLLCPHDWGKKNVVGNMKKESFRNIWLGEAFLKARKLLAAGNREFKPCNVCDVKGTLMGSAHVEAWSLLQQKDSL